MAQILPFDDSSLDTRAFFDRFPESLESSGWVVSNANKKDGTPYTGQWAIEEAHVYPGFVGVTGLVMKSDAAYAAVSKVLPQPIVADDDDLVVQYEVKFQQEVSCAGAYVKLLSGDIDGSSFSDETPFQVRFGPDICGSENKVDLALQKAVNADTVISEMNDAPLARKNLLSNLYTLIIRRNRDVEIRINGQVAKAGNLYKSTGLMTPPLEEPSYIEDPTAEKPADWDEREFIIDESAEKPADYDEKYGDMWVADPAVNKPEGWNDDESVPKYIRDKTAQKPAEWNDDEDGEWIAPFIKNPLCAVGCGRWEAPMVVNPNYVGEWVPPSIENPAYRGPWTPPLIKNTAVTTSEILSQPITAVGFDLWSMQADTMFNNIYVGHSVVEAERIGNETFIPKLKVEQEIYDKTKPKPKHEPLAPPRTFEDILSLESDGVFANYVRAVKAFSLSQYEVTRAYWQQFQIDPLEAIILNPIRFVTSCVLMFAAFIVSIGLLNVLLFLFLSSKQNAEEEAQAAREKAAKEKREKEEELDRAAQEMLVGTTTGRASAGSTKSRKVN